MKNWANNVRWTPSIIEYPSSENEIQQLVLKAANDGKKVRVIGSGHSFTKLCTTDHVLISLDHYQGLVNVDRSGLRATVKGGTKLNTLGDLLFANGLAMENMGDIDVQSIAGTISTGTHGTGVTFGSISTQVTALRFVNGKGEIITCSRTDDSDLFKAAQVSLGLLGVITEITLQCVPAYKLLLQNRKEQLEDVLTSLPERKTNNRNFEYYWFPNTQLAWTKTANAVQKGEPDRSTVINQLSEYVVENYSFKILCEIARILPATNNFVSRISAASIPSLKKLNHSHKIYATVRLVKFTEMEYSVPADAYQDVFHEIVKTIGKHNFPVHFPIENRWVKKDNIPMSPAFGRDSAYIACHVYYKKDNSKYFKALEDIFRAYNGRPHWGKMHTLKAHDISDLYPEFDAFRHQRKLHDPEIIFGNEYLNRLLDL